MMFVFFLLQMVGVMYSLQVQDGRLDIRNVDWRTSPILRLSGEWRFYPNQLLDPTTTRWEDHEFILIRVPDSWHRYEWRGQYLPAYGYGTYRLLISSTNAPFLMGVRLPFWASSSAFFVNGVLLMEVGKVGTNRESYIPQMVPRYVSFTNTPVIDIVVQMANFYDNKGGMFNSPEIGKWETILSRHHINIAMDIFLAGSLFIMALYHFFLFALQRKEKNILYFSLLALSLSARTLINHECIFHLYIYDLPWRIQLRMDFILVNLIAIFAVAFMRSVFSNKIYQNILKYSIWLYVFLSIITLFFPEEIYYHTQIVYIVATVPLGFYILLSLIKNMFRNTEALLLFFGFSAFFLTALNDIFYAIQKFNVFELYLTPFGQLIFVFFQAFVLSRRFSVAYKVSENLKHNLEREVQRQTQELLREKNKLLQKNTIIEGELALARQIQLQFIPNKVVANNFAFYFHPMIQVGGDFFDIQQIDTKKWGIFISDVSGHGVPAAFITSLVKSHLLQTKHVQDPTALLYNLNDFLFPYLAGNFVTAIYAVYDEDQNLLSYANAGHLDPIIIHPSGALTPLPSLKRGVPLGIFRSNELSQIKKGYANHTYHFTEEKILLFTDGLIEAVSQTLHIPFEEILWNLPWKDLAPLSASEIVAAVIKSFKSHIQIEQIADDICVLCIEPPQNSVPPKEKI